MFNAEEIIELEKKWFKYKVKQKSKFYILILIALLALVFILYFYSLQLTDNQNTANIKVKTKSSELLVKSNNKKIQNNTPIVKPIKDKNSSVVLVQKEDNITKIKLVAEKNINNLPIKKEKTYHFNLIPTEQASELFSTDGKLHYNSPFYKKTIDPDPIDNQIKEKKIISSNDIDKQTIASKKKPAITIGMGELNSIEYLKEKFYATSSIVFALMLSEEYYKNKEYKNSLKWSLIANDINSIDEKSWYWFAKSKVQLKKKNDAIRALKAYLSNNESKSLNTLLKQIERGDIDEK